MLSRLRLGMPLFLLPLVLAAALPALGCTGGVPAHPDDDRLRALQFQAIEQQEAQLDRFERVIADRLVLKRLSGDEATYDILIISGGGQFGAFAAGLLHGWTNADPADEIADDFIAMPRFDVVTGVSTGALIAPFAYVGDEQSLKQTVDLYRNVDDKWAVARNRLAFLPFHTAFYNNRPLKQFIRDQVDDHLVEQIEEQRSDGRLLLVETTNLNLGLMRIWDVAHHIGSIDEPRDRIKRVQDVMLASTAIPAVFPAVKIEDSYHVDGGVSSQLFMLDDPLVLIRAVNDAVEQLREAGIAEEESNLKIRVWVIINGQLDGDVSRTAEHWTSVAGRSVSLMIRASTRAALRRVEIVDDLVDASTPATVETRYIHVPNDLTAPSGKLFDREFMNRLADHGEKVGRHGWAWQRWDGGPAIRP